MKNLTKRQTEIFNYIKDEIENNGYPPTRSEISKTFGFKSPNAAEDHLKALKKKGCLILLLEHREELLYQINHQEFL